MSYYGSIHWKEKILTVVHARLGCLVLISQVREMNDLLENGEEQLEKGTRPWKTQHVLGESERNVQQQTHSTQNERNDN